MRNLRGFTLVELLVVVAIIAVLLAILAPAMDRAVNEAEKARCAANLHGIANGGEQYRFAHKRAFPTLRLTGVEPDDVYYTYYYWGGSYGNKHNDKDLTQPRLINPFVGVDRRVLTIGETSGGLDLFKCPSDLGTRGGYAEENNYHHSPTSYYAWGTSYFYNSSGNRNDTTGLYNKRDTRNPPYRVVVSADTSSYSWFIYQATLRPFYETSRHTESSEFGWGNMQFADGHVAYTQAVLMELPDGSDDHVNGPDYTFAPNPTPGP